MKTLNMFFVRILYDSPYDIFKGLCKDVPYTSPMISNGFGPDTRRFHYYLEAFARIRYDFPMRSSGFCKDTLTIPL